MMAKKSSASANVELDISDRLEAIAPNNPSSSHVMMPLDTFEHHGPNGKHRCFVYEPMGSTVASMVEKLPWNPPRKFRSPKPHYPKWVAKRILKHALNGLAFIHENGIVHGDFQPGNLLFSIHGDLSSVDESKLGQNKSNITEPLERLDGQTDKWAPKYLVVSESLHEYADLTRDLEIKISDLGAAFWAKNPPESTVTPLALRAPELIFKESFDSSIDIWSFGCLIYEILTGVQLFNVYEMGADDRADTDGDHLLDLNDVIEPLPDSWLAKWPRASKYFGPNRERLVPDDEDEELEEDLQFANDEDFDDHDLDGDYGNDEAYPDHMADEPVEDENAEYDKLSAVDVDLANGSPIITNDSLEAQFDKKKPDEIDSEEAKIITDLILRYEPSERPTAADLLQHSWFKD